MSFINLNRLKNLDWPMVATLVALNCMGIVTIWSVSGIETGSVRSFLDSYPVRQFVFMLLGLVVLLITSCGNYLYLKKYAWWGYGLSIFLLIVVLTPIGIAHKGSQRWIPLGVINLQPSEVAKIGTVIALARYLMYKKNLQELIQLVPPFIIAILPTLLILLEPNLGSAMLFGPMFLLVLFAAGASPKHLITAVLVTVSLMPVAYQYGLKPYQKARIIGFINPQEVPLKEGYHLIRSRIAIGSGGVPGKGFGQSTEKYSQLVPERHNDFIFTVIGEEGGLIGAGTVLLLFMSLIFFLLKTAYFTREPFGRLYIVGLSVFLTCQIYVNIGMTVGLSPVTGLTLPFVSYGGSSLVMSYFAIGIAQSIKANSVPSFSERDHSSSRRVIKETPTQAEGVLNT